MLMNAIKTPENCPIFFPIFQKNIILSLKMRAFHSERVIHSSFSFFQDHQ